jgi:hypothetical protein
MYLNLGYTELISIEKLLKISPFEKLSSISQLPESKLTTANSWDNTEFFYLI